MKKKIFGGIAVLAIIVVVAWNVNLGSKTNIISNVTLANVEALATSEGIATPCYSNGDGCFDNYEFFPFDKPTL